MRIRFLRQQGVSALWVFRSVARGDGHPDTDVDLALEVEPNRRPTLFTLVHLQELIQQYLSTKVDLGLRRDIRPQIVPAFERDAVRVF